MRRARRKRNLLKYKFLYFQTAVFIFMILLYVIANAPDLLFLIRDAKLLPLLRTFIGIVVAYAAGPLIVIYLVRKAMIEHKGITGVNWRTYLNDSLYNDFCAQPSDIDPDDINYWKTQEIIARKRAEQGGGLEYVTNRKALDPETVYSTMDGTAGPESQADSVPEGDLLEGLPEFDPNQATEDWLGFVQDPNQANEDWLGFVQDPNQATEDWLGFVQDPNQATEDWLGFVQDPNGPNPFQRG